VGSLLARRLGFRFLDTGMMYRAFTWLVLERGVEPGDEETVGRMARQVSMNVSTTAAEQSQVHVDGVDATPFLVRPNVEANVSEVSRLPAVREAMVRIQREEARRGGIVVAGRDIGTVVLPDADLKVYLDASREERARRRWEQARLRGETVSQESVLRELERRDAIDSGRELSPLRPAADALILETDGLSLEQVVDKIMALAQ
jgi:cytidylate kinase